MDIELAQALAENELLKSLLYCTKRSCNNCGKVNCENFQRQRKDCCENWVSYKDYIKQLEEEKDKAWWEGFDICKAKAGEANVKLSDEITLLKAQIEKMKCCYNCSKWYDGECEESPKSKTFFCADFKCDNWEIADD